MDEDTNELLVDKLDRWRLWAEEVIDEAYPKQRHAFGFTQPVSISGWV